MCDFSTEGVKGLLPKLGKGRKDGRGGVEQTAEIRSRRRLVVGEELKLCDKGDEESGLLSTNFNA